MMTTQEWQAHRARMAADAAKQRLEDRLIFISSVVIVSATWYVLLSLGIIQ